MMTFDEFKDFVRDNIKEMLPDRYDTADVTISENIKNNDQKVTYVSIRREDVEVTPSIILEPFYTEYANTGELDAVMTQIAKMQIDHENDLSVDKSIFTDWEKVKDRLLCRLINRENNEEYLADKPFTPMEDLAVVYAIDVHTSREGMASVVITDTIMDKLGVDVEQLHKQALANIDSDRIVFRNIGDVLSDMMPGAGDLMLENSKDTMPLYVMTNDVMVNGAGVVLCQQKMDEIAEKLGGDFIVIPSSTHECLIMPKNDQFDRSMIENMIVEVNTTMVPISDRLSDHSYIYDSVNHELVRADRMEERDNDRNMDGRDGAPGTDEQKTAVSDERNQDNKAQGNRSAEGRVSESRTDASAKKEAEPKRSMKERIAEKKMEASNLNSSLPKLEKKQEKALG